jgi:DNA-binding response OmpR family regulator
MSAIPKILLVDDDRTLSPMVKEYLEAKDFDCTLHHNAFDAFMI